VKWFVDEPPLAAARRLVVDDAELLPQGVPVEHPSTIRSLFSGTAVASLVAETPAAWSPWTSARIARLLGNGSVTVVGVLMMYFVRSRLVSLATRAAASRFF
jgi:hypothetical protein